MSIQNYWSLSATEQRLIRYASRRINIVPWDYDEPVAETGFEDAPGTSVTLRADGSVKLSNPDGLPTELVDGLLGQAV